MNHDFWKGIEATQFIIMITLFLDNLEMCLRITFMLTYLSISSVFLQTNETSFWFALVNFALSRILVLLVRLLSSTGRQIVITGRFSGWGCIRLFGCSKLQVVICVQIIREHHDSGFPGLGGVPG